MKTPSSPLDEISNRSELLDATRSRHTYWHDAARGLKRAVLGDRIITLAESEYRVCYEARRVVEEADYLFLKHVARGKRCVFDVGANVGATTLVMASVIDPKGRVFAFESSEVACLAIRENAMLNKLSLNIEVVNAVVGDRSGDAVDFYWDVVSPRSSAVMPPPTRKPLAIRKATLALDDFAARSTTPPELIKIDAEGSEARILKGMQTVLYAHRPIVAMELHAWPGTTVEQNAGGILETLSDLDYKMIDLPSLTPIKSPQFFSDMPSSTDSLQSRNQVLLLHQSDPIPPSVTEFFLQRRANRSRH